MVARTMVSAGEIATSLSRAYSLKFLKSGSSSSDQSRKASRQYLRFDLRYGGGSNSPLRSLECSRESRILDSELPHLRSTLRKGSALPEVICRDVTSARDASQPLLGQ
jgi:hypothetical protein